MNQSIIPTITATVTDRNANAISRNQVLKWRRQIARLADYFKNHLIHDSGPLGNGSFIEDNLLDPRMGPEISRTLRR